MRKPALKHSTISDVAALAGVSKSTVSAVLNNKKIRESTRRAVLRVIEESSKRPRTRTTPRSCSASRRWRATMGI